MNTKALHNLTCGLYMLSSKSGDKAGGCIINTAMQVTSKPLRITVTVNKANFTHELIQKSGVFALSLLDENAALWAVPSTLDSRAAGMWTSSRD